MGYFLIGSDTHCPHIGHFISFTCLFVCTFISRMLMTPSFVKLQPVNAPLESDQVIGLNVCRPVLSG